MGNVMMETDGTNMMRGDARVEDGTKRPTIPKVAEKLRAQMAEAEATLIRTVEIIEGPCGDRDVNVENRPIGCFLEDLDDMTVRLARISALAHRMERHFNEC